MITLFSRICKLENAVLARQNIHTFSDTDAKMYFSYAIQWYIPFFLTSPLLMCKMCLVMYSILLQTAALS